jgi:hypothetical protein
MKEVIHAVKDEVSVLKQASPIPAKMISPFAYSG